MRTVEVQILKDWSKFLLKHFPKLHPSLVLYLRSTPEIAYERMLSRNRPEEMGISFEYINQLHLLHENWLHLPGQYEEFTGDFNIESEIFEINANLKKDSIVTEYEKVLKKINGV